MQLELAMFCAGSWTDIKCVFYYYYYILALMRIGELLFAVSIAKSNPLMCCNIQIKMWAKIFVRFALSLTVTEISTIIDYYLVDIGKVWPMWLSTNHKNLEKNCSKIASSTEHAWNGQNFTFLTLCDLIIWHIQYLVSHRQGLTHTYLPQKFRKISIKIATCREVTRIDIQTIKPIKISTHAQNS